MTLQKRRQNGAFVIAIDGYPTTQEQLLHIAEGLAEKFRPSLIVPEAGLSRIRPKSCCGTIIVIGSWIGRLGRDYAKCYLENRPFRPTRQYLMDIKDDKPFPDILAWGDFLFDFDDNQYPEYIFSRCVEEFLQKELRVFYPECETEIITSCANWSIASQYPELSSSAYEKLDLLFNAQLSS